MLKPTIRGYRVKERLGKGGMGEVWAAEHVFLYARVAIKVLLPEYSGDRDQVARFHNEAVAAHNVTHAGVVKILDCGYCDDPANAPYLIMELLEGQTLAKRLGAERLSLAEACNIACQVADTMDACHLAGIVHRDLKPENLFLVENDRSRASPGMLVKVLDFGIAKLTSALRVTGSDPDRRAVGCAMGTAEYMAPELWRDASTADARADVYALGCIAFEMCSGRRPFNISSNPEAYYKHANEIPPRVSTYSSVPAALDEIIASALEKDPSKRPSMQHLRRVFSTVATPESAVSWPDYSQSEHGVPGPGQPEPGVAVLLGRSSQNTTAPERPPWASAAPPVPVLAARKSRWIVIGGIPLMALVVVVYLTSRYQARTHPAAPSIGITRPDNDSHRCPRGMTHIPAATFVMGSPAGVGRDEEHPAHPMQLAGYCIDRTEVTVADYAGCVAAGECRPAAEPGDAISSLCNGNRADRQNHPVNCVDWDQAKAYCTFAKKRLLTEAEWEYAARGPEGLMYPWGNEPPSPERLNACGSECRLLGRRMKFEDPDAVMYDDNDQWEATAPVARFPGGVSPFGVYDMSGNVWEWTDDWYSGYTPDGSPGRATNNPRGPSRVIRGGAWTTPETSGVRGASRYPMEPALLRVDIGFRCGREE